jgi:hypothetical protein
VPCDPDEGVAGPEVGEGRVRPIGRREPPPGGGWVDDLP